jgi:hypothetical protein
VGRLAAARVAGEGEGMDKEEEGERRLHEEGDGPAARLR